jgi:thioredoxin reductase (NADPH)
VKSFSVAKQPFEIKTADKTYFAKSIIVATGAKTNWLNIPGEKELIGKGVSSCAPCDAPFFKDKKVGVVGGGDSAMEEALFLTRFASKVSLIHRRDDFRASKIMLDRAQKHDKIQFITNAVVEDIYDPSKKEVTALKLRDVRDGRVWDHPTSAMFLGIGHIPNAKMFSGQLDMDQDGYLKTTNNVFTKVPGVYACGDVQDRRYRQAITAAGSGCMAALEVEKYLEEQGH